MLDPFKSYVVQVVSLGILGQQCGAQQGQSREYYYFEYFHSAKVPDAVQASSKPLGRKNSADNEVATRVWFRSECLGTDQC